MNFPSWASRRLPTTAMCLLVFLSSGAQAGINEQRTAREIPDGTVLSFGADVAFRPSESLFGLHASYGGPRNALRINRGNERLHCFLILKADIRDRRFLNSELQIARGVQLTLARPELESSRDGVAMWDIARFEIIEDALFNELRCLSRVLILENGAPRSLMSEPAFAFALTEMLGSNQIDINLPVPTRLAR